ncbi:hypothetical protein ACTMTJ_37455 [Phytohabitans sp. LJ34]|uniref:hypothetical protein n=1 Tax=Phytohabitans sp. LJ34 TaxID=3452217 RepID=UPI003F8ACAB6
MAGPDTTSTSGPASTPSEAGSTSASATASAPTSSASTQTPLTAANGTDVRACRNADCEILISGQVEIPLAPKFGCTRFAVVYFPPNRVAFNVDCAKTGNVTGYFLGRGTLRLVIAVTLEVDKIDGTGAVLHFLPKNTTEDPTRNQVSGQDGAAFT